MGRASERIPANYRWRRICTQDTAGERCIASAERSERAERVVFRRSQNAKKETFQSDRECSMQMTPLLEVLQVLCMANLEVIWWVCDECWPTGGLSAQQLFQMVVAPHPGVPNGDGGKVNKAGDESA
jgi:hypothetical protein